MVCQMQQLIRLLSKNSSMHENTCSQRVIWLKGKLSKMFKVCYMFFHFYEFDLFKKDRKFKKESINGEAFSPFLLNLYFLQKA